MYEISEAVKAKLRQFDEKINYHDLSQVEEIVKYGPFLPYGKFGDSSYKAPWLKKRCNKYRQKLSEDVDYIKIKENLGDFAKEFENKDVIAFDDAYGSYHGTNCSVQIWLMKMEYYESPNIFLIVSNFNKYRYRGTIIKIDKLGDAMDYFVGLNILDGLKIIEMWWDINYITKYDKWRELLFNNTESWEYVDKRMIPKEPKNGKIIKQMEFKINGNVTEKIESGKLITSNSDIMETCGSNNMMTIQKYNPLHDMH